MYGNAVRMGSTWKQLSVMGILYTQRDATYTIFFIIISALHVSGGFSAHHQELIKLYAQPWVLSCVFLLSTAGVDGLELMQLIQCSLLLSALYMFRAVFPPIIRSL